VRPTARLSSCGHARHGIQVNGHDSNVLRAMARPVARKIIFELEIEQPVHAFDAPMPPCGAGDAFDIKRREADISTVVWMKS
jgi:hypothetical protein